LDSNSAQDHKEIQRYEENHTYCNCGHRMGWSIVPVDFWRQKPTADSQTYKSKGLMCNVRLAKANLSKIVIEIEALFKYASFHKIKTFTCIILQTKRVFVVSFLK